jgi:ATP-dependent helicase HrpB
MRFARTSGLPIDEALPQLRQALITHPSVILCAPPGAGKSTVVPLALMDEPWAAGRRILMLEPRRLAARAVAQRMAGTLGEPVGRTVGYRMRLDTRVSRATRIEVLTEGVLTRMLQSDPALEGVAAVIFDEHHERSLQADLALALALDARANLTPALRIVVMSATLDTASVQRLLEDAPVVSARGRAFPVETHHLGRSAPPLPQTGPSHGATDGAERLAASLVRRALEEEHGDVLVFLPGAREIRRVRSLLERSGVASQVRVLPLYGDLGAEEQEAALAPGPSGTRRVVLATNIAETSLTIEGVRVVVDSGLVRRQRFDPATGMSRLETRRISRASAEQRQGRAGRLEAGVCYRAWSESAHRSLPPFTAPEITEADLTPLALELSSWGVGDAAELKWLDPPPAALLASARELLERLGALDRSGRITAHGREMSRLAVHPRLGHMLLRAHELGATGLAADLAALLTERDLLRAGLGASDADVRNRLEAFRGAGGRETPLDRAALHAARRTAHALAQQLGRPAGSSSAAPAEPITVGALLALAYPDRIGRRRAGDDGRFTLANGRGAYFREAQSLARQELIVAVDLEDREREALIRLAAPLSREDLERMLPERIERRESVAWSTRERGVLARRTVRLDALVLEESALGEVPGGEARAAMLEGLAELGIGALPWTREARDLQARVAFVRDRLDGGSRWPDLADATLAATAADWLGPWLEGVTRAEHLARLPLLEALLARLSWEERRELERLAPSHLTVPSGSRIRIDYLDDSGPSVSVRLQEVFGLDATPLIGGDRVPVTFRLLSPAHRPVQVTRDLKSFWRGAYREVRKDLRGRYPKHDWPENPLEAGPVRGVRRRT